MENDKQLNRVFLALADEKRRLILSLCAEKPRKVTELAQYVDCGIAQVSKNLKLLEASELIYKVKKGRSVVCHMNYDTWADIAEYFSMITQFWDNKLRNLEEYIQRLKQ